MKGGARTALAASLTSAGTLILAFPPWGWQWLAWIALVPLLAFVRQSTPARALALGYATGLIWEGLGAAWLVASGAHPLAYALLTAFAALRLMVFAALAGPLLRCGAWLAVPALWTLLEYLRTNLGWLSIPWGLLGQSQYEVLPVARVAAWGGVYGVSFVLVCGNVVVAGLAMALHSRLGGDTDAFRPLLRRLAPVLAAGATPLVLAAFSVQVSSSGARPLRAAVVQGGMYAREEHGLEGRAETFERYQRLTRGAASVGADLVIWPEAAVPGAIPYDPGALGLLYRTAHETGAPLLVGSGGRDKATPGTGNTAVANSAFLISPRGAVAGRYDKVRLLPFNEYLPLRSLVPWPDWVASPEMVDATAGRGPTVFITEGRRYAVLICWENLFAADFRAAARQGVDFVVSLTNEAFTRSEAGHAQMFTMNLFRAIENGLPVVRVATTGISAVVAPDGRVIGRVEDVSRRTAEVYGWINVEIPAAHPPTPYLRFGDAWLVLPALFLAASLVPRPGRRRRGSPS